MACKMTDIFLPSFIAIYFVQTNLKSVGMNDAVFLSARCPVLLLFHNYNLAGGFLLTLLVCTPLSSV